MKSRNNGRIIGLEEGSVKVYTPDFFKFILEKSKIKEKDNCYLDADNYGFENIQERKKPYSDFSYNGESTDEKFDDINESKNPDKILPYIYRESKEESETKYTVYTYKGSIEIEPYRVHDERSIDFFNNCDEPYMKINSKKLLENEILRAIFSQDGSHTFKELKDEKSQPYVQIKNKVSIFYQPKHILRKNEAVRYIQKARDKVFAFCAFNNIPIIIKITGAKIDPKYFINVWKSPFIRYPELYRTITQNKSQNDDNDDDDDYDDDYDDDDDNHKGKNKNKGEDKVKGKKCEFYFSSYTNLNQKETQSSNKNVVSLKYIAMPKIDTIKNKELLKEDINLPLTIVQKTKPTYPNYEELENLPLGSFLPVYYRFSQIIERIRSEYKVNIKLNETAFTDHVFVVSFLELGYTPMNTYLPKMESNIVIKDTSKNFLSYLNQEKNVSSIMEIASKFTGSLFLPLEPGGVQILKENSETRHIAYYTRNKNSIMANANVIAAGLRTSNYFIVPVTPSHVSHFLESLDCALINWTRFGLTKYNLRYNQTSNQNNAYKEIPKTKMIIYFEPGQRPFDAEIAIKNIKYHCSKYDDILDIEFIGDIESLSKIIKIDTRKDEFKISHLELLFSIAAFATVNDCADYLELDDSYEAKSSFAFD